ncbi:hypothetical protein RclHR1_01300013 [Rhizophagus clarus]|uniref:Uncharacterized protein n=1 Tax=Rhizophagus clarus TaxID=94130 RepID=A0A2Z6R1B2_9GLOM|nr:hypothetical protein RclHR1_01300013 [Rhizophagus clarus]GES95696.1 hypothetical protein GLOIN_2v1763705 [Rhizophagus clarus]
MNENSQRSFTYNSSDTMETSRLHDFSTEIAAVQQTTQRQVSSILPHDTSYNFTSTFDVATHITQHQPVLDYLKFFHLSLGYFYLVICKIILQDSSNDHDHYDHEFFYQHPRYPSIGYHVSCKLLPDSLIETILNGEVYEMNFDTEKFLSLNQRFTLELSLKQRLFHRMHFGTQSVLLAGITNDGDLSSNENITNNQDAMD